MPIFLREHSNGMYRVDVYYICKVLVDVPTFIVLPFIFTTICYWMIGLYPDPIAYLTACGIVILITNAAVSFGYFLSCLAGTENLALALAPTCIIPLMLFGGFFLNSGTVPSYFVWLAVSKLLSDRLPNSYRYEDIITVYRKLVRMLLTRSFFSFLIRFNFTVYFVVQIRKRSLSYQPVVSGGKHYLQFPGSFPMRKQWPCRFEDVEF